MHRILLVVTLVAGCSRSEAPCEPRTEVPGADEVVRANDTFAWNLYDVVRSEPGNLFYSPFSLSTALGMTLGGAGSETAEEMRTALGVVADDADHHEALGALGRELDGASCGTEIAIANRLWAQQDFPFEPAFLNLTAEAYDAPVGEVDYRADPEGARQDINGWVSEQTAGRIPELLQPGTIDGYTRLVLTNAIYFLGSWAAAFDPSLTTDREFAAPAGPVQVPMMAMNGELRSASADGVQALSLPYQGDETSMLILLPTEDLASLEAEITPELVDELVGALQPTEIDVWLPRFEVDYRLPIVPALKSLGMEQAFSAIDADFSAMSSEPLFVGDVVHQAFVRVDEEGTEAAAATAVEMQEESMPPSFHADHPFLFLIRDDVTGALLFMGRIEDPAG